jgi:rare lipoprotein A
MQHTAWDNSGVKSRLKSFVPGEMPLRRGNATLTTGCRILFELMLVFSKLKVLLGAVAIAGMSILSPLPSQAATCGYASHYGMGDGFHGQITANGERFNTYAHTAAHPYLPMGTRLRVTRGSRSVIIRVNDRGPYYGGRQLDLSYAAFSSLAPPSRGEIRVCYSRV